jgi:hypothetical protein
MRTSGSGAMSFIRENDFIMEIISKD